jgi:hypothetical protein
MSGVNLAEFFQKMEKTCFQNEWYFAKDFGQRIDHIVVDSNFISKVEDFATLQCFGAGRVGCSDHCPLWVKFEGFQTKNTDDQKCESKINSPSEGEANAVRLGWQEENKNFGGKTLTGKPGKLHSFKGGSAAKNELCRDTMSREFQLLAEAFNQPPPSFREEEITPEFAEGEDDFETESMFSFSGSEQGEQPSMESDDDTFMEFAEESAFEDCAFPVLRCMIQGQKVRVLVDSGATLDLINEKLAKILDGKAGCERHRVDAIRIRVANGSKYEAKEALRLRLEIGGLQAEPSIRSDYTSTGRQGN